MVEWWQAILIALASGGLSAGAALLAQYRQQRHDFQMQKLRFHAERENREEEAVRRQRRDRLQPVFDLMDEMDKRMSYRMWRKAIREMREGGELANLMNQEFPGGVPPHLLDDLEKEIPKATAPLISQWISVLARIGDEGLRRDMVLLVIMIATPELDIPKLPVRMADIYDRLERYATSID